ncbi:MAG: type II secretion system protein [Capsulimonadaceae bacterium]
MSRNRSKGRGFGITELCVVVAFVGILASILLPVLAQAREGGHVGVSNQPVDFTLLDCIRDLNVYFPAGACSTSAGIHRITGSSNPSGLYRMSAGLLDRTARPSPGI